MLEISGATDTLCHVDDSQKPFRFRDENRGSDVDRTLRPKLLSEFVGQGRVCRNLKVGIDAAKMRGEPLEHVLLSGLPGLGKTSLANIVASELGVEIFVSSGPALERTGELVGLLTNLKRGDVLFIDEIHRLPRVVEEYLYSAMEDFAIDIVIDQGPSARSVRLSVERFTLLGATTREGLLSAPFRARFGLVEKLELYPAADLIAILRRSAALLRIACDDGTLELIAARSRGTPRVANRLLRRVRDLADVGGSPSITQAIAEQMMANLGIDAAGLEETDRKILRVLDRSGSIPVGVKTIAAAVGEEEDTIETVYEPYLLSIGFLTRTPRGRMLTDHGRKHLGLPPLLGSGQGQQTLFS